MANAFDEANHSCRREIDSGAPFTSEVLCQEQKSSMHFQNPTFECDGIEQNQHMPTTVTNVMDDRHSIAAVNETVLEDDTWFIKASTVYAKSREVVVKRRGIWFTLLSAFLESLLAMAVASLDGSLSPYQLSFISYLLLLLCSGPVVVHQKASFEHTWKAYGLLLIRSVLGATVTSLMYVTYELMPVASAKSIFYCNPVIAGILGWIILKESYSIVEAIFSLTTLGGVLLIAQPPFLFPSEDSSDSETNSNVIGSIISLLSAFIVAVVWVILRKLCLYGMPAQVALAVYSIISAVFIGILTTVLGQWSLPGCGMDRFALIGMGVLYFLCQTLSYIALKTESASVVSILYSSDIMFTFVLEFLFFGLVPNFVTVIGAVVIVVSVVGIAMKGFLDDNESSDNSIKDAKSCSEK